MSNMSGWPANLDMPQWMRNTTRDIAELKRRSRPTAAGILGPGLGPWATLVNDWNDEVTLYNGIFYCDLGSANSPDPTDRWIGTVEATKDGNGFMEVWDLDTPGLPEHYVRTFSTDLSGVRTFNTWTLVPTGGGGGSNPIGPAGGDLTGSYPNPQVAAGAIDSSKILDGTIVAGDVATAFKDGTAATPSMRTLGTGSLQAAAGDDARFTNSRTPTGSAGGDLSGTYPNPNVALAAGLNMAAGVSTPSTPAAGRQQLYVKSDGHVYKLGSDGKEQLVDNANVTLAPVRMATGVNYTLSGLQTVDGVVGAAGDRVLVNGQLVIADNGIYIMGTGAWTRAPDANTAAKLVRASNVTVLEGTGSRSVTYTLTSTVTTLGTDPVVYRAVLFVDYTYALTLPTPVAVGHMAYNSSQKAVVVANPFGGWDDAMGYTVCTSTTRPTFIGPGHEIFETDTAKCYVFDGTTWQIVGFGAGGGGGSSPTGPAGGSLTGTYPNPTIAALAVTDAMVAAANKDGLTSVASMRTLGTGAQQAAAGNDSRLSNSRTPTGSAGGSLAGTYPNPTIAASAVGNTELAALAVTDAKVAAANKDGLAATPSMRTLGTGAAQAAAGNDARFTDARTPTGTAGGDLTGTYPNPTVAALAITDAKVAAANKDGVAGTPSMRTLGTGSQQATAGNDSRLSDARTPTGSAGGDLTGTYPNPTVTALAITDAKVAAANKDGAAGTPSMRTLGTGAAQAAAGNDARFTDARTPTGAAGGDLGGTYPNPNVTLAAGLNMAASVATPATPSSGRQQLYVKSDGRLYTIGNAGKEQLVGEAFQTLAPCRMATTANITLSGLQTIDGVVGAAGDRVMVQAQTTVANNGPYVMAAGAWARAADADTAAKLAFGTQVSVLEGTWFKNVTLTQLETVTTLGTSPVVFKPKLVMDYGNIFQYPPNPARGQVYGNFITKMVAIWDGSAWMDMNGLFICTSTTRPGFPAPGNLIYETDTFKTLIWDGTTWQVTGNGSTPTGSAGGSLTGSYPNPTIASGAVTTTEIANGTITTTDINSTSLSTIMVTICTSGTRPGSPLTGQEIYETDTGLFYMWSGSAWLNQAGTDSGWVVLTSGTVTGTWGCKYRVKSGWTEVMIDGACTAVTAVTLTLTTAAIPTAYRPPTVARSGGYFAGHPGTVWCDAAGILFGLHQSGANRGSVASTFSWPH